MCDPFTVPAMSCSISDRKINKFVPEIKGGILISQCNCNKRNGLQMECRRSDCQNKVRRRSNNSMNANNQINNEMTAHCPPEMYENPPMTPSMRPEMISHNDHDENSPHVSHDMPPESALKPEEMSDVVYVDYGHNAFQDGNMQNMMNNHQMQARVNQGKMSAPQMLSQTQMMPHAQMMPSHENQGTGDQKTQQITSTQMMASPQNAQFYPQQIQMPQNMSIPHLQMGDGKSMEIMSSIPQNYSMPQGYNMMGSMPQSYNYYPMMQQGQMIQQTPMQPMNMQNYTDSMQNPCPN